MSAVPWAQILVSRVKIAEQKKPEPDDYNNSVKLEGWQPHTGMCHHFIPQCHIYQYFTVMETCDQKAHILYVVSEWGANRAGR